MSHSCAFCGHRTTEVLDFGTVALAGAFLKPSQFEAEKRYPLALHFCEKCLAVQVPVHVPRETLFNDYFYFTSAIGTMRDHFTRYAREMVDRFQIQSAIEIGCNDGALARPLADLGVKVTGIDPAANVVTSIADARVKVINAFFSADAVREVGKVDAVLANNVFAHISDINTATDAVRECLKDDGIFVFEVNRLDSLISDLAYDWIYHEHLYYYSLLALDRHLLNHGLQIFDCKRIPTHAGSMRYYACKTGRNPIQKAVQKQRDYERWIGLHKIDRLMKFAQDAEAHMAEFRALVKSWQQHDLTVAGYGACGRTNTLLQACRLGSKEIAYIVDDAPAKQGYCSPGTHIPIVSRERLHAQVPDKLIVFAWSFLQEIEAKLCGFKGEIVIPLPHIYTQKKAA